MLVLQISFQISLPPAKQSGSSIVNQIPFYYPQHPHLVHLSHILSTVSERMLFNVNSAIIAAISWGEEINFQ
jgi:hypothetical protein